MLFKEHSSSGIVANSGEVSDSACSRPAAAILDARARMLAAQILSRAANLTLHCSVLSLQKMSAARVQHSASGNATKTGEVSDSACSRPAAAILDACARMLAAQILSRAANLTPRCSVMRHTADAR